MRIVLAVSIADIIIVVKPSKPAPQTKPKIGGSGSKGVSLDLMIQPKLGTFSNNVDEGFPPSDPNGLCNPSHLISEVIQELLNQTITKVYDREAQLIGEFSTEFKIPVSKPPPQTKPIEGSGSKGVMDQRTHPKLGTFSNNIEGVPPLYNTAPTQSLNKLYKSS